MEQVEDAMAAAMDALRQARLAATAEGHGGLGGSLGVLVGAGLGLEAQRGVSRGVIVLRLVKLELSCFSRTDALGEEAKGDRFRALVVYIDDSFIKHWIPVKPIYGTLCCYILVICLSCTSNVYIICLSYFSNISVLF